MSTSHLCPHIQGRHLVLWVCHGGIADGKSTLGKAGTNPLKCQFLKQSCRGDWLTWFSNAWHNWKLVNVSCTDQKQNSWYILKYIYIIYLNDSFNVHRQIDLTYQISIDFDSSAGNGWQSLSCCTSDSAAHRARWAPDRGHSANGELTGNPGIQWELERVVDLWDLWDAS